MYANCTLLSDGKRLGLSSAKLKFIAKLSQAKPQLQLSWMALASLNFT